MSGYQPVPESECPDTGWHETHRYCPHCTWTEPQPEPVWTVQTDDLVGGWLVTTYPHPLSEHDLRNDGDPTKRGVIACECSTKAYAILIAKLLNGSAPSDGSQTDG